jgi:hypothetical protein
LAVEFKQKDKQLRGVFDFVLSRGFWESGGRTGAVAWTGR